MTKPTPPIGAITPALTTPADLIAAGLAQPEQAAMLQRTAQLFRIRVTSQMQSALTNAPDDPVAAQFLPTSQELTGDGLSDPIGDNAHAPVPGLTHRYPDRVILHVTKTCDVYCRFCFRRETVGETGPLAPQQLDAALDYIAATSTIREVILTGGDPLTLSLRRLHMVLTRLDALNHVQMVRFHTRVPVVAPDRITPELVELLASLRMTAWMVIHTNHAQELTPPARKALRLMADAGIPLLSQSVLLRKINDSHDALQDLFTTLSALRVKPYYLHHCDLARGAGHFRTTIAAGRALMQGLRGPLPGHCLPTYVLDIPGGFGKVPVTADHFTEISPGRWRVTDWQGAAHDYLDPED
ncbi:lysine 2,3-aminomutase [Thioclava sp. SK-1]|uniref:lysine-2,3-aminomutase-like protein n=1 Tax=Thioclava sp. SK-1 TaxID=1889770 RepID=UPI000826D301|nr:lysine-2,3-aminomutase-like protein [Thioclava sp. SK-1]OCX66512.1 lysine 2,3-aminomutase [Thioclava sp. SK-1]